MHFNSHKKHKIHDENIGKTLRAVVKSEFSTVYRTQLGQPRHAKITNRSVSERQNEKNRSKGVAKGSRDLLLEFWDPLNISGTV